MIKLRAEKLVAVDSPDHVNTWGTRRDNSKNERFNQKLYRLFQKDLIKVLDLGCSGGGFVKSCIDDGNIAVGLEGSDWSKIHERAEWGSIPNHLFTCDITERFEFEDDGGPIRFDVITAWEVIEHLKSDKILNVIANVKRHLSQNGLWIISVSPKSDIVRGIELHQTIQDRRNWIGFFESNGLYHHKEYYPYFNGHYVRGGKKERDSIVLFLGFNKDRLPVPNIGFREKIGDWWFGSGLQKFLRRCLTA